MKIWYDACTGKHVRYGVAIAQRLRASGLEVVLTTRKHPDTIGLLESLGESFKIVGKYSPTSQCSRLKESLKRQLAFCEMFENESPDLAMSHGSVELCRVAFGLGIPTISTAEAPHAIAANKLAVPLVDYLVVSKAIPPREYVRFGAEKIVQFDGVDEVAWVKGYKPNTRKYEKPLIVVRQMETKASYAEDKLDVTEQLAKKLVSLGKVMFIPRYDRRPRPDLIIPQEFIDSVSLSANADLVVSVGGTISREAALQGTPSIVIDTFGKSYVNDYLSDRGFPLSTVEPNQVLQLARKYLGQKRDVRERLEELENPVDLVEEIIQTELDLK